jgi:PAS domain S-box-containing protein
MTADDLTLGTSIAVPPGPGVPSSSSPSWADHAAAVILVVSGPDHRIDYANLAAARAAAAGSGALLGQPVGSLFAFAPAAWLAAAPAQAQAVPHAIGATPAWWDVTATPIETGAPGPALLITALDVTPYRHAGAESLAALRDSERRLYDVLLQIPVAAFILDAPDGRVSFRSRRLDEVLGEIHAEREVARATQQGWALHPDGQPYEIMDYPSRRALFNGETVQAEPMIFRRGDGRLIDLEMHAGPVRNAAGEITAAVAVALDVTDRRRAEARGAFRLALQDALRALTDPHEVLKLAATHLGRHLGAARIGYSEMQPDGETVLITNGYVDGMPPVAGLFRLDTFGAGHAAAMRAGRTVAYEDARTHADNLPFSAALGTRAHVSVPLLRDGSYTGSLYVTHSQPHRWSEDEIALIEDVAARIWDTAERLRAESRLRESEERLRLVLDSTGLGAWEFDVATGRTIRSARHDEILGYAATPPDWRLESFLAHVVPADRAPLEAGFRAACAQARDWEAECGAIRADGAPIWLRLRASPHRGPDGQVVRMIGTLADITRRRQAEEAARASAARFEAFAQSMPCMVFICRPDGSLDWFNERVGAYTGLDEAAVRAEIWATVHPDDAEMAGILWTGALAAGTSFRTEYRVRRHDGVYRWHLTYAIPVRDGAGAIAYWIGTGNDIQDLKDAEGAMAALNATLEQQVQERTAALLAAEARLRQSQKMEAVGQLTGGLAHDFNNLLTGISGSLELLKIRVGQGRIGELDRYIDVAQGAAQRAAALTHRLLAFSRRQTLDPKPTAMNRLIAGLDELIRRTMGPAIDVTVRAAPDLWGVLVDANQLENALLNLCINARDAMPDGGALTIETANATLDAEEAARLDLAPGAYIHLSVTDTGAGMTEEVIARAFDPFFTTKPIGAGTGLGLSMVYGLARQSGGQARIRSAPGEGARVCLFLPRHDGPAEAAAPDEPTSVPAGGGETVLLVDDEPDVRMLVEEALAGLGYHLIAAEDGVQGLGLLNALPRVDLLITDVGLPGGINGRQLADAALSHHKHLKILFITGYAETAVIGEGELPACMHIMTKPFSLDTLALRVREVLSGK